jgi:hypothetical protein
MPGLAPGIQVLCVFDRNEVVDGRDNPCRCGGSPGHDGSA